MLSIVSARAPAHRDWFQYWTGSGAELACVAGLTALAATLSAMPHAARWLSRSLTGGLLGAASLGLLSCGPRPIEGLRTYEYLGGDQRSGVLPYRETPPAGGPYNPLWQTCAAYAQPVYNEYAVHSLARGAVWVTYRPELDAAEAQALSTLLAGQPAALLSPYPNLPSPIVMTAWNRQLSVDRADDPRLTRFLKEVLPQNSAPEKGSPCSGGFGGTR